MSEQATAGKVVAIRYELKNDAGEVLDKSSGDPLSYMHGHGNIIPGLEKELEGKQPGDKVQVEVPPEEGYGERQGPGPQAVPKSALPDDLEPQAGMQLAAQSPDGSVTPVWITGVEDQQVWVDVNHPLAGETLHFDVEVVSVRDATDEEKTHGHVHGPGGHQH
jgi:FKBP-type peptidyl-prolyl cis-trans isomerase SlyD